MNTSSIAFKVLLVFGLGLGLVSCSDDEDDAPENTAPSQTDAVPQFTGSEATLVAIKTRTTTDTPLGPIGIDLGTAVAVFFEDGSSNFLNVGAVTCEEAALNRFANNTYVYTPGATEPTGIDFGTSVTWSVEGGNGFPAVNSTVQFGFPTVGAISSAGTVSRANGYILTLENLSSADSVVYSIGNYSKTLAGNASSCAFTAAELENVAAGVSIAQAAAYRFENDNVQGKELYFVNQMVVTKTIEVQ